MPTTSPAKPSIAISFAGWRWTWGQLRRMATTLAITVAAYWLYGLIAVPLIEPRADAHHDDLLTTALAGAEADRNRTKELEGLFPPGDWRLRNPKILENNQTKLLMQNYQNLGNGQIVIEPCTVIYTPDGPFADEAERLRRTVVMDAPKGAALQFDRPLQLGRGQVGQLIGGRLIGPISIRSEGKSPGPEDDLLILTQDLQLDGQHVFTPQPVSFRVGPNYGSGRDLHIYLGTATGPAKNSTLPNLGNLESFELRQVDRLHVESLKPARSGAAAAPAPTAQPAPFMPGGGDQDVPLEVTCKGPFRFTMADQVATFNDQVDVWRVNPNGASDKLTCNTLSIFFGDKRPPLPTTPKPPKREPPSLMDLEARRLVAKGEPAIVIAPAQQMEARGQALAFDLPTNQITMEGGEPVWLTQAGNEIRARSLSYAPNPNSEQLGRAVARGPGELKGQSPDRPGQVLEARWTDQLTVQPEGQQQLISLTGGAALNVPQMGSLAAQTIHFWMSSVAPAGPAPQKQQYQPDRLVAEKNVELKSPQMSARVEHLDVKFEPTAAPAAATGGRAERRSSGSVIRRTADNQRQRLQLTALRMAGEPLSGMWGGGKGGDQHFEITGQRLRARMTLAGNQQGELAEVQVEENVRLVETKSSSPHDRPMLVTGDRIHALAPATPQGTVMVTGRPGHFEARGLGLTGSNINLNRGTNRLWIDGPGQMQLPMNQGLDGQAVAAGSTLDVSWSGGMTFDGKQARFDAAVSATAPQGTLRTETLEVRLKDEIRFDQQQQPAGGAHGQPQVEQVLCRGGVLMESQSVGGPDQPPSLQRMQIADLVINMISGATHANGPGWVLRIARGDEPQWSALAAGPGGAASAPRPPTANPDALSCLVVRFQGTLTGNVHRREMLFRDLVKTAYGPVPSWQSTLDPDKPETLGPQGVAIRTDELYVSQPAGPATGRPAVELNAVGNTIVESSSYTARAMRLSYAQAKDLLILEGDGRNDATLYRQEQIGGAPITTAAQRIYVHPSTKQVRIDNARSLVLPTMPERK